MSDKEGTPKNGNAAILATLASSTNMWVQLAIVGLVAFSGFFNWAATWQSSDRNQQVIVDKADKIREEAKKQINEIHQWLKESQDEFHKGNIDSSINRKILNQFKEEVADFERRQMVVLSNQSTMLENQNKLLVEQHDIERHIQKWMEEHSKQPTPSN